MLKQQKNANGKHLSAADSIFKVNSLANLFIYAYLMASFHAMFCLR